MGMLRELRSRLASEKRIPPYIVFSDRALNDMCARLPVSRDEFMTVSGVGFRKAEEYGEAFIGVVREYCRRHGLKPLPEPAASGKPRKNPDPEQRRRFCLTPEEVDKALIAGTKVPEKHKKKAVRGALCIFAVTYIPLMAKVFRTAAEMIGNRKEG